MTLAVLTTAVSRAYSCFRCARVAAAPAAAASACRLKTDGSAGANSTASTGAPPHGNRRCNNASSAAAAGKAGPQSFSKQIRLRGRRARRERRSVRKDLRASWFLGGVGESLSGPMGVAAPRSSSLGGDTHSPSGRPRQMGRARTPLHYLKISTGLSNKLVVTIDQLIELETYVLVNFETQKVD